MNDTRTATLRTTWNGTLIAATSVAAAKLLGWEITVDDLAPFLPVIAVVIGVFYRASLAIAARWPMLGTILFGKTTAPEYSPLPPPAARLD